MSKLYQKQSVHDPPSQIGFLTSKEQGKGCQGAMFGLKSLHQGSKRQKIKDRMEDVEVY